MNIGRKIEDFKINVLGQEPGYPFMIRGRKDVIFVHITKTAGTSMRRDLNFHRIRKDFSGYTHSKHTSARDIKFIVGDEVFNKAYKFAFVRNPWSRIFSLYRFKKRKRAELEIHNENSFEAFVKSYFKYPQPSLAFAGKNYWTQLDWLSDNEGNVMVDYIGKFENLSEDYKVISKKVLGKITTLPTLNVNHPSLDYREQYTDEMAEMINNYFKKDIEYFNYSF